MAGVMQVMPIFHSTYNPGNDEPVATGIVPEFHKSATSVLFSLAKVGKFVFYLEMLSSS